MDRESKIHTQESLCLVVQLILMNISAPINHEVLCIRCGPCSQRIYN